MHSLAKLSALVCASALLLFFGAACGGAPPAPVTPTESPSSTPPPPSTAPPPSLIPAPTPSARCAPGTAPLFLTSVVLAQDVASTTNAPIGITEQYAPAQPKFHAVVTLDNAPDPTRIRAVWYLVEAAGYQSNSQISEAELTTRGSQNVDLTLESSSGAWPLGTYCVEIYVSSNLAFSKTFKVVDNRAPTLASSNPIVQLVMAPSVNPATNAPLNPTHRFTTNTPIIHAAVQIQNAPTNTDFRTRWYPPGLAPIDKELTAGGTQWLNFNLVPLAGSFPAGSYKIELYVNGARAQTLEFEVR